MGEGPEPLETIETAAEPTSTTARGETTSTSDEIAAKKDEPSDQMTEEIAARYDRLRRLSTKQVIEKLMRLEKGNPIGIDSVDGDILAQLLLKRLGHTGSDQTASA
jgi:hypothetical protein